MGTTHHHHHHGDHSHDHSHGHHHHFGTKNIESRKRLKVVLLMTLAFMFVEAIGGYYTNSLALMSDAVHMLTDTVALGLSLFAFFMTTRPATDVRTYGFYRMEILAAFVNGIFLVLLSLAIFFGAWERYHNPEHIRAIEMFWISLVGFLFNLFGAWFLLRGADRENLNIRGALFHILGDALGSVGAIVASLAVFFFDWTRADAIVSVAIGFIIIASAFRLILDTAHVILEAAPHHLNTDEIRKAISQVPMVCEVHDLHVWSITSGMVSLSVHVVAGEGGPGAGGSRHGLLVAIRDMLRDKFHIEHVTIQIEDESLKKQEPHI